MKIIKQASRIAQSMTSLALATFMHIDICHSMNQDSQFPDEEISAFSIAQDYRCPSPTELDLETTEPSEPRSEQFISPTPELTAAHCASLHPDDSSTQSPCDSIPLPSPKRPRVESHEKLSHVLSQQPTIQQITAADSDYIHRILTDYWKHQLNESTLNKKYYEYSAKMIKLINSDSKAITENNFIEKMLNWIKKKFDPTTNTCRSTTLYHYIHCLQYLVPAINATLGWNIPEYPVLKITSRSSYVPFQELLNHYLPEHAHTHTPPQDATSSTQCDASTQTMSHLNSFGTQTSPPLPPSPTLAQASPLSLEKLQPQHDALSPSSCLTESNTSHNDPLMAENIQSILEHHWQSELSDSSKRSTFSGYVRKMEAFATEAPEPITKDNFLKQFISYIRQTRFHDTNTCRATTLQHDLRALEATLCVFNQEFDWHMPEYSTRDLLRSRDNSGMIHVQDMLDYYQ